MGRVMERVKLTSLFESKKSVEAKTAIDTSATAIVLPKDMTGALGLKLKRCEKQRSDARILVWLRFAPSKSICFVRQLGMFANRCTE
ncbi:MAG TPA: hypothetical protein EYP10_14120 [Armatimonadetes bacterium]|nr:hypothetical protein [Armatimonadota bacterium]